MDPQQTTSPVSVRESLPDRISIWILLALIALIPVLFIPSANVPFQFTKVMLMYVGVTASFVAWIIGRLKDGKLSFSRHGVFVALGAIVVTYLISSLFSPARTVSLVGQGYEISTFSFIAALALFVFLVSNLFIDKRRSAMVHLAFLVSFAIVALYQFARLLFGPNFLSFGVLTGPTDNLIGSWNDLGVYFGATALFSFITLELLVIQRNARIICGVVLGVSLFFLTVIGYSSVWYALGAFALIFFIYNFSFNKASLIQDSPMHSTDGRRTVPVISLVVLIIAFTFILFKGNMYSNLGNLGATFFNRFAVSNVEVRPSWSSTLAVAKQSLSQDPLFGVGPNRFVNAWLQAKPAEINNTVFWSADFNYGIGILPTLLVTTGIVGFLAWVAFMALFLYAGFRILFFKISDSISSYVSVSSFILALYFWIFMIFHVPSAPLVVLAFAFTGVFFASAIASGSMPYKTYDIVRDPRMSFVSVLVLLGILLGVLVFGYSIGKRYIASIYYNQALAAANVRGDVQSAETNLGRALSFSEDALYYRTLSQLNLIRMNTLIAQQSSVAPDVLRSQFQNYLSTAQASAQRALAIDRTNYENWITAGNVYAAVVPLNIDQAYEQALAAYTEARKLNPSSPAISLVMAQLEAAHNNIPQAKTNIAEAIRLKQNYTDAIYMLAQLQINEGDLKSAIQSVEALTFTNVNDPGVFFQLGLLRYNNNDFTGAASAFEQAINLTPDYANARYFLGLSLAKQGKNDLALQQFKAVEATNPENAEVKLIISNLQAGKDPLAGTSLDNAPEKRSNPPVTEKDAAGKATPETADR